ncbi:phospholipase D-like domain-containing protein [Bdellovibrio sp.]|uniref:phospholipase D-like domain-containing protein n=1 Tax=Bdellovibrio sp. TaxID=28201 RepID=UPI0032216B44
MSSGNRLNLNKLLIPTDSKEGKPLEDFSAISGNVEVVFRNLEDRLIAEIQKSKFVVGCVAWLTSYRVLDALAQTKVSLIVQKEDFLRPDHYSKATLHAKYEKLTSGSLERYSFPGIGGSLNTCGDTEIGAIHCVGNFNSDKSPAHPRMHNKFVVFCDVIDKDPEHPKIAPISVWTGSFNFSHNANDSFENAVIINDPKIAGAYLNEFEQIYALGEKLNWESEWSAPIRRIGS